MQFFFSTSRSFQFLLVFLSECPIYSLNCHLYSQVALHVSLNVCFLRYKPFSWCLGNLVCIFLFRSLERKFELFGVQFAFRACLFCRFALCRASEGLNIRRMGLFSFCDYVYVRFDLFNDGQILSF